MSDPHAPTTGREAFLVASSLLDHWRDAGDDPDTVDEYQQALEQDGIRPSVVLLTMQADAKAAKAAGARLRRAKPDKLAMMAARVQAAMELAGGDVTSFTDRLQELTEQAHAEDTPSFLDRFCTFRCRWDRSLEGETSQALERMPGQDRSIIQGLARAYLHQLTAATSWRDDEPVANLLAMVRFLHDTGTCGVRLPMHDEQHVPMPKDGWPWSATA